MTTSFGSNGDGERVDPGPDLLLGINKYGETPGRGDRVFRLTPETLAAFRGLRAAAMLAGFHEDLFTLESAYRDPDRQGVLAGNARAEYGDAAGKWVAQKRSEHITGRAFDLNLGPKNTSVNATAGAFDELPAYRWLQENAAQFGLNPYGAEPWHWSYNVR